MAKQSNLEDLSENTGWSGSTSSSGEDDEQKNEISANLDDEEELEAVAGSGILDEDDSQSTEDDRAARDVKTEDEENEQVMRLEWMMETSLLLSIFIFIVSFFQQAIGFFLKFYAFPI